MDNMQLNNIVSQILHIILGFTIFFVPCFLGAYAKDFYDIAHKKKKKINLKNAAASALTIACVAAGFTDVILNKYGLQIPFSLFFLLGACSNKPVEMIFNGSFLKVILKFLGKQKGNLQDSIQEAIDEGKENKDKKE